MSKTFSLFRNQQCRPTVEQQIQRLIAVAPAMIRRTYHRLEIDTRDECVRMARLAYNTLTRLGVECEPLDCLVTCWNSRFDEYLKTGVDHPDAYRHTNDPFRLTAAGVSVTDSLMTHLAVHVPETRQLIDFDAWQLSRPHRGLVYPGVLAISWSDDRNRWTFESPEGNAEYQPFPTSILGPPPPLDERLDWCATNPEMRDLAKALARKVMSQTERRRPMATTEKTKSSKEKAPPLNV